MLVVKDLDEFFIANIHLEASLRNFYQQSFSERDVSFIIMQCLKVLEKDNV